MWGGERGFEAVSIVQIPASSPFMLLPGHQGRVTNKKPKLQKLCHWQAGSGFSCTRTHTPIAGSAQVPASFWPPAPA